MTAGAGAGAPANVLIVAGPTASGKSACAAAIAREFDGVVINADSMQVYRDLSIITARPPEAEMQAVPHRLYGVLDGADLCSAARWRDLALSEIRDALARGKLPILCGGTGLYIRALTEGLSDIPDIPDTVRDAVRDRGDRLGSAALHAELAGRDPVMAARLNPGDSQRVARALEVVLATGRSLADWQGRPGDGSPDGLRFLTIALLPPRQQLYDTINDRFRHMMDIGAVDEVRDLMARNLDPRLPVMKALGVPEVMAHLRGEMSLATALETGATKTRQYAKRQMTWLKRQIIIDKLENEKFSERLKPEIFAFVRENMLTR